MGASAGEVDPEARAKIRPEQLIPHSIDESKLPPGYIARGGDCLKDEEKIEDGMKLFGIEPMKMPWGNDRWVEWSPTICRTIGGKEK